LRPIE